MNNSPFRSRWPRWLEPLRRCLTPVPESREEITEMLRRAEAREELDSEALGIIEGALQVSDMQVRDIMIPKAQLVTVRADASPRELLPIVIQSAHSRFPVIDSDGDVLGILLAKDLLPLALAEDIETFEIKDHVRPASFVPESKRLNVLLREFRATRSHMAVVIDEYGTMAGVVTIEDVLEQIVGEIEDEHDVDDDSYIKRFDRTNYVVKAVTPIDEFNEVFHTDFSDDEFDTIGGIVVQQFGRVPKRNESIEIEGLTFRVLNADNRRVRLLRVFVDESPE